MRTLITLLFSAIALGCMQPATAFEIQSTGIRLVIPEGVHPEGKPQLAQVMGYFCDQKADAEVLSAYLNERRVKRVDLEYALARCQADVREVAGFFPLKSGDYPVLFVNTLAPRNPYFLVLGLPDGETKKLQEARAEMQK